MLSYCRRHANNRQVIVITNAKRINTFRSVKFCRRRFYARVNVLALRVEHFHAKEKKIMKNKSKTEKYVLFVHTAHSSQLTALRFN